MKRHKGPFPGNIQLSVFTVNYVLACIFLYWLLSFLFVNLEVVFIVIITIVYLIIATIIWAHLYILFSIPQHLAGSFDYIKNDIARGRLKNLMDFAREISAFLVSFYSYSFFDIALSAVKFKDQDLIISDRRNEIALNWDEVGQMAAKEEKIVIHGKIAVGKKKYFAYTVPVYFGGTFLGFFTVFTGGKLGKLRLQLLSDLEEHFIDDQLVHILNSQKTKNRE